MGHAASAAGGCSSVGSWLCVGFSGSHPHPDFNYKKKGHLPEREEQGDRSRSRNFFGLRRAELACLRRFSFGLRRQTRARPTC